MVKARNKTVDSTSSNKSKRSVSIRKYEIAYNKCIKLSRKTKRCKKSLKKLQPSTLPNKSSRRPNKNSRKRSRKRSSKRSNKRSRKYINSIKRRNNIISPLDRSKRPLNEYQKFVKHESSKSVYKGKNAKSRLRAISRLWKRRSSDKSRN